MKGFTLVEMLVALAIFGLISAAGVTVMRFTVDNQTIVRAHTDRVAAFQRTRTILKYDLAQAAARRTRGEDGRPARDSFYGASSDRPGVLLRLARRGWENPDAAPRASVQYVEYRVSDGRLERSARPELDGAKLGMPQVLLDRIRSAGVRFLWHGQWIENLPGGPSDPLPQAVSLDMTIDDIGAVRQLFVVTGESR
jgi:general secretion pathway protein J